MQSSSYTRRPRQCHGKACRQKLRHAHLIWLTMNAGIAPTAGTHRPRCAGLRPCALFAYARVLYRRLPHSSPTCTSPRFVWCSERAGKSPGASVRSDRWIHSNRICSLSSFPDASVRPCERTYLSICCVNVWAVQCVLICRPYVPVSSSYDSAVAVRSL